MLVLLAALLAQAQAPEPLPDPAQLACIEAVLPDLETALAGGLPTPAAEHLLTETGNGPIDAALEHCFAAAPVSASRRSFLLTYLFAEAGRRQLTAALSQAGVTAEVLRRAEAVPALRVFTYGQPRMLAFAGQVRAPFAALAIPETLDRQVLFYVYDARVARITGGILRPPARGPGYNAADLYGDLPAFGLYSDYPPGAVILFDVAADGAVGQCINIGGFWDSDFYDRFCAAVQRRRYQPARDTAGQPIPGVSDLDYGIMSDDLWRALLISNERSLRSARALPRP